jgi:uncharacterized membrane protein YqjE
MESNAGSAGQFAAHSSNLAHRLMAIGENRLELLKVEMREERERLLHSVLLAFGVAAFGLLAAMALTAATVIWLWPTSPVAVLLTFTALYAAGGVWLYRRLTGLFRDREILAASIGQLEKDSCLFGREADGNPPRLGKQSLIIESEVNRAQLAGEINALKTDAGAIAGRAKSVGAVASSAAALVAGLAAFRRTRAAGAGAKLSWLPAILKGAGLVSTIWLAARARKHGAGNKSAHPPK